MENTLSQQGCLIFSQKDLALQCVGFERPWRALCVQYRDIHGHWPRGLYGGQKYVKAWQKPMCPAETSRGPDTFLARFLSQLTAPAEFVSQFWNGR